MFLFEQFYFAVIRIVIVLIWFLTIPQHIERNYCHDTDAFAWKFHFGPGVKKCTNVISLSNKNKFFEFCELEKETLQQLLNTVIWTGELYFVLRVCGTSMIEIPGFISQISFQKDDKGIKDNLYQDDPSQQTSQETNLVWVKSNRW